MKQHPDSKHVFEDSWQYQGWQIIDCQTCGFKHVFSLPEPENTQVLKNKLRSVHS